MEKNIIGDLQEKIILENYRKLDRYCRYLSIKKWDREDIIQDAFTKAWQYYDKKDITTALLKKIAYNQWVDKRRKEEKESRTSHIGYQKVNGEIIPIMILAEHLALHLTTKQGMVYMLVEVFSYRLKEAAEIMEMTEGTIKSLLFRARNQLNNNQKDSDTYTPHSKEEKIAISIFYEALKNDDPITIIEFVKSGKWNISTQSRAIPSSVMNMAA